MYWNCWKVPLIPTWETWFWCHFRCAYKWQQSGILSVSPGENLDSYHELWIAYTSTLFNRESGPLWSVRIAHANLAYSDAVAKYCFDRLNNYSLARGKVYAASNLGLSQSEEEICTAYPNWSAASLENLLLWTDDAGNKVAYGFDLLIS